MAAFKGGNANGTLVMYVAAPVGHGYGSSPGPCEQAARHESAWPEGMKG
jgi:hypothetical protein